MVIAGARSILFSPLWTSQLWDTLCRLQQERENPKKAHTVCSVTPRQTGEGWINQKGPNTVILRAHLSPVCSHRMRLRTSSHQASSPWSRAQLFLRSAMMDGEKRSVTWLCNRSFFDEIKSVLLFSTACWIPKFPFYFLFLVYNVWGRQEPEGTGEERKCKDPDNKKAFLSWKQNTKNISTNYVRHKAPALQCWHPPLQNIKKFS